MERTYYQRGQRRTLEEVEGIVPVKSAGRSAVRQALGTEAGAAELGLPAETFEAFRRADWHFVRSAPGTGRLIEERATEGPVQAAGKLVRRQDGRFAIVTQRLVVQLQEDIAEDEADEVLADLALELVGRLRFAPNLFEVDATAYPDALEASVALHEEPRVKIAEPSFQEHIPGRAAPSDPRYGEQWQWSNTGQSGGTPGADVSAEAAWGTTRGAGVRVAVIDNGFLSTHEDLQDGVLDTSGSFLDTDPGPAVRAQFVPGTNGMPVSDHGTFCAGLVGARQGNDRGGSGAAPECELMLLACLPDQVGDQVTLARAVAYAADPSSEVPGADPASGADILVCSLGPNEAVWELATALDLALSSAPRRARDGSGMAVFWAASNGENVDVLEDQVASHPDVIAVVRSTHDDLEDDAARGPEVELIAPGVDVLSTGGDGGYHLSTGTSFAAPCAAGCAALALAVHPGLSREQLRAVMRGSADKIGGVGYDAAGHNDDYGFGRVNAAAAVQVAEQLLRHEGEQGPEMAREVAREEAGEEHAMSKEAELPPLIHVEVRGAGVEDLRAFARETGADLGCRAIPRREADGWVVDAYLPEDRLEAARSSRSAGRVRLEVRENATAAGRERQAEVGTGNRFSGGDAGHGGATVRGTQLAPVRGLGEKR